MKANNKFHQKKDNSKIEYSVVIPVYNSEHTLEELYHRLISVFRTIKNSFEIIYVDDGSNDTSWKKLEEIHKRDKRVKIIQLTHNFGQHNALMCGFHFVRGNYIITLDDDLQNPPEEIPKLVDKMKEGYDLVYGIYISKKHNRFRRLGSSLMQIVYKKYFHTNSIITNFRIIKRQITQRIIDHDKSFVFMDGLLAWKTRDIGYIDVLHNERKYAQSGYKIKKLLTFSLNVITNFSIFPLQIASVLGLLFVFMGGVIAIFFFIKKILFHIPVANFSTLIVAITLLFISGIQLLTLGLIGEYLGRIYFNINKKPQYEIRKQLK